MDKIHRFSENMNPFKIDYKKIDIPLRKLIKTMNDVNWMITIGSCFGKKINKYTDFYIILEVSGSLGIENLIKMLSLSHAISYTECYEKKSKGFSNCVLYEAKLESPNYLHKDFSTTSATMGDGWFRFYLTFKGYPNSKKSNLSGIMGLIKSLREIKNGKSR